VEDLLPGVLQTGAIGVSKPSSGQGSINQGASNVVETNEKILQQLAVLQDECAIQSSLHQIFMPSHGDVKFFDPNFQIIRPCFKKVFMNAIAQFVTPTPICTGYL